MAGYDDRTLEQMENDAINRMRQMHSRSNNTFMTKQEYERSHGGQNTVKEACDSREKSEEPPKAEQGHCPRVVHHQQQNGGLMSTLSSLFSVDSDKLLIMGLILILSREKADQMLIMALVYILL